MSVHQVLIFTSQCTKFGNVLLENIQNGHETNHVYFYTDTL